MAGKLCWHPQSNVFKSLRDSLNNHLSNDFKVSLTPFDSNSLGTGTVAQKLTANFIHKVDLIKVLFSI